MAINYGKGKNTSNYNLLFRLLTLVKDLNPLAATVHWPGPRPHVCPCAWSCRVTCSMRITLYIMTDMLLAASDSVLAIN